MDMQQALLVTLLDPAQQEPVHRAVRVTVKPELSARNRAAARRLVDERLRHERDLVAKQTSQSNTLDKVLRGLVTTAEHVEVIQLHRAALLASHHDKVLRA